MNDQILVFGSQYFRSPTPLREDWENDLKKFKAYGFNTIKIWAQWRTNNPAENVYTFGDLKELLDIAEELGLKVIINIILDVAPAWFFKKYPESIMIMADGRKLMSQVTEYRQVGGAPGPCYHHTKAIAAKNRFVEELAKELKNHPALLIWDLWNEPEVTCGLAREANMSSMVCYCNSTYRAFIDWLKDKYKSIDLLNSTWQRNYNNFEEIELPLNPRTYRDMIDWRTFFADTLAQDLENRVKCIKKYDCQHPVMIHTVPPPYFNMINACCDDYKMAKLCDLFGNSIGSTPFPVALNVSSANGKEVMNAEIHAMGGETFNRPAIASYIEFKKHIFTPFARGIKGFLFWQYRPEILGKESPAWGLTDLEGNHTKQLDYAKKINDMLQEHQTITKTCKPLKSKIAIIKDSNNEIFAWCATGSTDKYSNSLFGAFRAFYDLNYNVDIITTDQLIENGLDNYKLVYYPLPYYLSEDIAAVIKDWIENGGVFVSESFFGAYQAETGLHSKLIPGYNFDKVFGAKEFHATTASKFVAAYGDKWCEFNGDREIVPIHYSSGNLDFELYGYHFCEEFSVTTGHSIAKFSNNATSIVENDFGKGKSIILGSLVGCGYEVTKYDGNLKFFQALAQKADIARFVNISKENIRADVLYSYEGIAVVVQNMKEYCGTISIDFKSNVQIERCIKAESKEIIEFQQINDIINFSIDVQAYDIQLYILE